MDVLRMLAELCKERDSLDEAIKVIERLAAGRRRSGQPPTFFQSSNSKTTRGQYERTAETRLRMAEAQRKVWAERKARRE
jgi:hypothetical protein